jgi:hypothetical protein
MRRLPGILAITFLVFFGGRIATASDEPAVSPGEAEFIASVQAALEGNDREALTRLSCWDGVDDEQRRKQEKEQESLLGREILKVELRPTPPGYRSEYTSRGVEYRVNLPVEGLLRIEFAGEFETQESRLFPYAVADDGYCIARVVRSALGEAAPKDKQLFIGVLVPSGTAEAEYVVSCSYESRGEERREKYEGSGATQKVIWGNKINWCRIWNRSDQAAVRLVLKENLETYFESDQVEPGRSLAYP